MHAELYTDLSGHINVSCVHNRKNINSFVLLARIFCLFHFFYKYKFANSYYKSYFILA